MRFSTRGRYGLKAMFVLAQHYGKGPLPLKQVAENQGISEAYLEQLIGELRKSGLVKSVRGAQGGYLLGKAPEKITVGDIIRVLEGPIAPADCVVADDADICDQADRCVTRLIWERVRDSVSEVLDSVSLADMLAQASEIQGGSPQCQPISQ
ncbi:MAG TPA: Rrf2 family transcriptional regulator [Firmicutes bacterium]|nr:Rrf2 family transcriptional regulator [Bacillota bacterium]